MYIIGINAFHGDSSACIFKNGNLIAAAEEERFRRIKHWAGFPSESIRWCLQEAQISLENIDYIAINQDPKANFLKKIIYIFKNRPNLKYIFDRFKNKKARSNLINYLKVSFPSSKFSGTFMSVEHHLAHLSSTYHTSTFDNSVILSVDGFGDFSSTSWGIGKDIKVKIDGRINFPHSLGIFYQAFTQFIGFNNYGDEYKMMGLAPYGKPIYLNKMRKILNLKDNGEFILNLDFFCHHRENFKYEWNDSTPSVGNLFSKKIEILFGKARNKNDPLTQHHFDIAHSAQAMYEEAFFHLLNKLYSKYKIENLSLSGGCAMNSVANGKIHLKTPFKKVYIQAAAGDAGGAIGAALVIWHKFGGKLSKKKIISHSHAYWGPSFNDNYINNLLEKMKKNISNEGCHYSFFSNFNNLTNKTAIEISKGKVIGWFQGKMEWGPRALGNRSILCDPRRAEMKEILNSKIKKREDFRPFAPSILRDSVAEWFETDHEVPFMMQVYQIKENKRREIPAVTHIDGSGRLQTVTKDTNYRYYELIKSFEKLTGVPIVLNTSFNENEPIVCKPEEALNTFLRTKMDLLILGNWIIERK